MVAFQYMLVREPGSSQSAVDVAALGQIRRAKALAPAKCPWCRGRKFLVDLSWRKVPGVEIAWCSGPWPSTPFNVPKPCATNTVSGSSCRSDVRLIPKLHSMPSISIRLYLE